MSTPSHLFTSTSVAGLEVPHRIVMAPMTRARSTQPGDIPNAMNARYYAQRASAALIVTEAAQISPQGKGERYLLTGENLTMLQLLGKIAAITGANLPKAIPLGAAKMLSTWQRFLYGLGGPVPKVSASAIAVMSSGQFIDGTKALHELAFRAEVSVDEAIKRALEWFHAKGLLKTIARPR